MVKKKKTQKNTTQFEAKNLIISLRPPKIELIKNFQATKARDAIPCHVPPRRHAKVSIHLFTFVFCQRL